MSIFRLPDLGEGLQEAEISAWHVTPGTTVAADQPLLEVETHKALVDIPSPQAGKIVRTFGEPGDLLKVGDPLVEFEGGDKAEASSDAEAGRSRDAQRANPCRATAAIMRIFRRAASAGSVAARSAQNRGPS